MERLPRHVNWVTAESASEVLADLIAALWSYLHPLVTYLLSLVRHNSIDRMEHMYLEE